MRSPLDVPISVATPFDPPAQPWLPGHRGVDLAAEGAGGHVAGAAASEAVVDAFRPLVGNVSVSPHEVLEADVYARLSSTLAAHEAEAERLEAELREAQSGRREEWAAADADQASAETPSGAQDSSPFSGTSGSEPGSGATGSSSNPGADDSTPFNPS